MKIVLKAINEQEMDTFLNKEKVVIECYTPNCVHCKSIQKLVEDSALKWEKEVCFGMVDVTKLPSIAEKFQIMSVPTLLFLKRGELKQKVVGETYQEVIDQMIRRL